MRKSLTLPMAPPVRLRRRKSLQEDGHSQSFTHCRRRRVERASSRPLAASQSMELTLLDHVSVEFIKAVVPGKNKLASPRYVMRITNQAMDQTWEMGRTFREFYELKETLVKALDHGHFCPSNCPWLYMYVTHHFPRRRLFRSRSPTVISGRLTELQVFFNTVLRMAKENRNLECAISASRLPQLIYDFFFEGMVFDRADFQRLSERMSFNGVSGGRNSTILESEPSSMSDDDCCSICCRPLVAGDLSVAIAPVSSNDSSRKTVGTSEFSSFHSSSTGSSDDPVMTSLTTLDCGHCFHDECILEKLNESLACPLCVEHALGAAA